MAADLFLLLYLLVLLERSCSSKLTHLAKPLESSFNQLSIPIYEITALEKKMTAFVIPNAIQITTRQAKYTFASFLSRDTTFDVIFNIWRLARPEDGASVMSSGRPSLDGPSRNSVVGGINASNSAVGVGAAVGVAAVPGTGAKVPAVVRKATQCACGREGKHYTETAMDVCIPGTPEKIHNLIFASGFIKDFMTKDQKLMGQFFTSLIFGTLLTGTFATMNRDPDV